MNSKRNPYANKLLDWKKKLDVLEQKINSSGELINIFLQIFTSKYMTELHEELNRNESQVRAAINAFSQRSAL